MVVVVLQVKALAFLLVLLPACASAPTDTCDAGRCDTAHECSTSTDCAGLFFCPFCDDGICASHAPDDAGACPFDERCTSSTDCSGLMPGVCGTPACDVFGFIGAPPVVGVPLGCYVAPKVTCEAHPCFGDAECADAG